MAKNKGENGGAIEPPDFEAAKRIYTNDVIPANKAQKQAMKEASDAWKAVKKVRVHTAGYRQAMKIAEMEEADQQAYLRSFRAGLQQRGVTLHLDIVDKMNGVNEADLEIVPTGAAPEIELATVN